MLHVLGVTFLKHIPIISWSPLNILASLTDVTVLELSDQSFLLCRQMLWNVWHKPVRTGRWPILKRWVPSAYLITEICSSLGVLGSVGFWNYIALSNSLSEEPAEFPSCFNNEVMPSSPWCALMLWKALKIPCGCLKLVLLLLLPGFDRIQSRAEGRPHYQYPPDKIVWQPAGTEPDPCHWALLQGTGRSWWFPSMVLWTEWDSENLSSLICICFADRTHISPHKTLKGMNNRTTQLFIFAICETSVWN